MRFRLFIMFLLLAAPILVAASDGGWLARVPPRNRLQPNPYAENKDAAAAGAILFQRNCSSCHGTTAHGIAAHPSLHSERVQNATDGELHWLLSNGNLGRGMPSWSRLPDPQRWQIVRYLHSLPDKE